MAPERHPAAQGVVRDDVEGAMPMNGSDDSETLMSAKELPSGKLLPEPREPEGQREIGGVGRDGDGLDDHELRGRRRGQVPSAGPPMRPAARPLCTIAAVVPGSSRSTTLTPPHPLRRGAVLEGAVLEQLLGEGRAGRQQYRAQTGAGEQAEQDRGSRFDASVGCHAAGVLPPPAASPAETQAFLRECS
jgi:hypothetical protein